MSPLISIITPCYNSSSFIAATLDSVIAQDYKNWELIIVDDKSTDDSKIIVERYAAQNKQIKHILLHENQGVANARNVGLAAASGKYIAFLDSDDIWLPEKLSKQLAFMEAGLFKMSFLAYHRINEHGRVISSKIGTPKQIGYTKLLWHNLIIFSTAMIRKDALGDIKFKKVGHEDWVFWLDFFKRNGDGFGLNDLLVEYRIRSGSVSANKLKAAKYTWLILRESEKIGFLRSAYLFSKYAFATVWKRLK